MLPLIHQRVTKDQLRAVTAIHDLGLASGFATGSFCRITTDRLAMVFGVVAYGSPHPVTNGFLIHVIEPVQNDAMPRGEQWYKRLPIEQEEGCQSSQ